MAVFAPEFVFTVIVADPVAFAVTSPTVDTVATPVFELDHVTDLSVALLGDTVAASCFVAPTESEVDVGETATPVGVVDEDVGIVTLRAELCAEFPAELYACTVKL